MLRLNETEISHGRVLWQTRLKSQGAKAQERAARSVPGISPSADGVSGVMHFWGVGQALDAAIILHPLRRLHELALSWLASLQKNDAEAQECRIRVILADAGVLKPKVFLFRR